MDTNKQTENWLHRLKDEPKELRVTGEDNEANPTLEIALLMDCTSSMSEWIQKAKETLITIIDKIIQECKDEGNLAVRVSFIGYRDIKDANRFRIMEFTSEIGAVKEFISATNAEGGDDEAEDLQGGLKLALLQDWTEEATKRVFIISDAPCHGQKYHSVGCSDYYPEGSPDNLVLEDLMKEFCKKDIEFQFMKLRNICDKMIEIMKQCHQEIEVTDMTGITSAPSYYASSSYATYGRDELLSSSGATLERGARIDDLIEKSRDLNSVSQSFGQKAKKSNTGLAKQSNPGLMSQFFSWCSKKKEPVVKRSSMESESIRSDNMRYESRRQERESRRQERMMEKKSRALPRGEDLMMMESSAGSVGSGAVGCMAMASMPMHSDELSEMERRLACLRDDYTPPAREAAVEKAPPKDVFLDEFVKCTVNQVSRKQADVRSKRELRLNDLSQI